MSIKLLTTAIALALATAMAPVFGQVTNEEKSKVVKDAPGKAPSMPKSTAGATGKAGTGGASVPVTTAEKSKEGKEAPGTGKVGERGKATDPVTTAEKSKVVNEPSGKVPSMPKSTAGAAGKTGTGGAPVPVTTEEKSKVVK